jgi:hypothetical protein
MEKAPRASNEAGPDREAVMLGSLYPKDRARYLALGQVGMEMVAPIALGAVIDHYVEWVAPWCTVAGAAFGLVGGLLHLVYLLNKLDSSKSSKP